MFRTMSRCQSSNKENTIKTREKLDLLLDLADELHSFDGATPLERIRPALLKFFSASKLIGIGRSSHQIWHRARKVEGDAHWPKLDDLIYARADKVKYGRANLPEQSTLYAGQNLFTALDEIRAATGDVVQVIQLRPIDGVQVTCHVVGEYQMFNATGRSMIGSDKLMEKLAHEQMNEPDEFLIRLFLDSVCAKLFRRPVSDIEPEHYKITALYAELLLPLGSGLIYPSVRNAGSMNLAVSKETFDSHFEVIQTDVYKIIRNLGYGLYELDHLRRCCDFAVDGSINWYSRKSRKMTWGPQVGWREVEPLVPGWRKSNGVN